MLRCAIPIRWDQGCWGLEVLKELSRAQWLDLLHLPAARVPDVLLLRGGRSLDLHLNRHRALFDTLDDLLVTNGIIEQALIGTRGTDDSYLAAEARARREIDRQLAASG
jgi:hypothetical protein